MELALVDLSCVLVDGCLFCAWREPRTRPAPRRSTALSHVWQYLKNASSSALRITQCRQQPNRVCYVSLRHEELSHFRYFCACISARGIHRSYDECGTTNVITRVTNLGGHPNVYESWPACTSEVATCGRIRLRKLFPNQSLRSDER